MRVLNALWEREGPQSVRDLQPAFEGVAYTTLMTTLDRLHRKGVLLREKSAAPSSTARASRRTRSLRSRRPGAPGRLRRPRSQLKPILSFFIETVSREDRESLAALEQLIEERRRPARRGEAMTPPLILAALLASAAVTVATIVGWLMTAWPRGAVACRGLSAPSRAKAARTDAPAAARGGRDSRPDADSRVRAYEAGGPSRPGRCCSRSD